MISVIIIGHGCFASGILSSLELIAGRHDNITAIDFTSNMTSNDLYSQLHQLLDSKSETLILCDLLGGTPFKEAVAVMENFPKSVINVLAGLNLAMLIETIFARQTDLSFNQLTDHLLKVSKEGIVDWQSLSSHIEASNQNEEGGI
ncbi:PTS sugar transporter subunit IIA [Streptococcus pantholopis]|uniref:PTS N-acetylgalactosamine transporter subunit IIA n=1 Tax=Streptococcus pantholopis TaxID=1811193 RepID=A0A172Q7C6_9STRE|nr:PTS sugar transporter subunit IIA [Streptococcus pantholopis]AND79356.1 PTS N-acetylgalactosamine transporter subunit IIA [Streptococcus pantholopis]